MYAWYLFHLCLQRHCASVAFQGAQTVKSSGLEVLRSNVFGIPSRVDCWKLNLAASPDAEGCKCNGEDGRYCFPDIADLVFLDADVQCSVGAGCNTFTAKGTVDMVDLAIVEGCPKPETGSLKGYLFKDEKKNRVFVSDSPKPGAKTCQTNYKVLAKRKDLSLVECELITGRTHQIRAQFAHAGHPLLGDGKYGKLDKRFDRTYQALYSYKLTFTFSTEAGSLEHLNGKSFQVDKVDFVEEYFPGTRI